MSSCCSGDACSTSPPVASDACPICGRKGAGVERITLKALLTPDALRRGVPPSPRFCANEQCSVVYFDNSASSVFLTTDLTLPVHAKQPQNDAVPLCYCFGHTPESIRVEMTLTGTSSAAKAITDEVRAGRCACEVRNPKGACCLGDVVKTERRLAAELSMVTNY